MHNARRTVLHSFAAYVCRGCGTQIPYPSRYRKCPVCGIKW